MVNLIETEDGQSGNLDQVTKDLNEAVAARVAAPKEQKPNEVQADKPLEGDDVPVKLRGKTLKEVVSIYTNLESQYGRMANDLGQQRVLTDRLLNLKRETDLGANGAPAKVEMPQLKPADVLENPTAAIEKVVDARLKGRDQQEQVNAATQAAQIAYNQFVTAHPDFQSFVNDAGFVEWIQASPSRRRSAAQAANGDWYMATDLLTEFKEQKAAKTQTVVETNETNLERARQASLENGGANNGGNKPSGKIYKRADLIRLRIERPDYYYSDEVQAEVLKAYQEKRVR